MQSDQLKSQKAELQQRYNKVKKAIQSDDLKLKDALKKLESSEPSIQISVVALSDAKRSWTPTAG